MTDHPFQERVDYRHAVDRPSLDVGIGWGGGRVAMYQLDEEDRHTQRWLLFDSLQVHCGEIAAIAAILERQAPPRRRLHPARCAALSTPRPVHLHRLRTPLLAPRTRLGT
jgi:hypothetical protein